MPVPSDFGAIGFRSGFGGVPNFGDRGTFFNSGFFPGGSSGLFNIPSNEAGGFVTRLPRNDSARRARIDGPRLVRDKTYAILSIVPDSSRSSGRPSTFENFILTSVRSTFQERFQIAQTWDGAIIYFMDRAPEVWDFSGILFTMLLDGDGDVWRNQFIRLYRDELRGTQCVRKGTRAVIDYDGIQVSGYVLGATINQDSNDLNHVLFGFQLYVTSVKPVPFENSFAENDRVLQLSQFGAIG